MSLLASIGFFAVSCGVLVAVLIYDAVDRIRWARFDAEASRKLLMKRIEQRRKEMRGL